MIPLLTHPLRTFGTSHPDSFLEAYTSLIQHILTLPLLPNRLPLSSLMQFSANLQLHAASVLSPSISQLVSALGVEAKVHFLANMFVPPRYTTLPPASLTTLLQLSAVVMSTLPPGALEPNSPATTWKQGVESESGFDLKGFLQLSISPRTLVPLLRLDERTSKRLQTLVAPTHINSLIRATENHSAARIGFCDFLSALCFVWPLHTDSVLNTSIFSRSGGFVRELYHLYVRSSPLGNEVGLASLLGTSYTIYGIIYCPPIPWQTLRMRALGSRFFV
jgi:ubiquitin-protein ligase E3 C